MADEGSKLYELTNLLSQKNVVTNLIENQANANKILKLKF